MGNLQETIDRLPTKNYRFQRVKITWPDWETALRGYKKAAGTVALLGCELEDARKHIESLWQPGMTWDNWSKDGWHLDHIKPCDSFNLRDAEQQKKCFHFTNLQPLWCNDNWAKGSRILS